MTLVVVDTFNHRVFSDTRITHRYDEEYLTNDIFTYTFKSILNRKIRKNFSWGMSERFIDDYQKIRPCGRLLIFGAGDAFEVSRFRQSLLNKKRTRVKDKNTVVYCVYKTPSGNLRTYRYTTGKVEVFDSFDYSMNEKYFCLSSGSGSNAFSGTIDYIVDNEFGGDKIKAFSDLDTIRRAFQTVIKNDTDQYTGGEMVEVNLNNRMDMFE